MPLDPACIWQGLPARFTRSFAQCKVAAFINERQHPVALKDTTIRHFKRGTLNPKTGQPFKQLTDGKALYLVLIWNKDGSASHSWRFNYRRPKSVKRATITIGEYPLVSLADAREKALAYRRMLTAGNDPMAERKAEKQEAINAAKQEERIAEGKAPVGSFQHVAEEMLAERLKANSWGDSYLASAERDLRLRCFPFFASRQCSELEGPAFVAMARAILYGEAEINGVRKADYHGAKRALIVAKKVMGYAVLSGFAKANPITALGEFSDVLGPNPADPEHHAAAETPEELKVVMLALDNAPWEQTRRLSWVAVQTAQRPRNLSAMQWEHLELDGDEPQWVIPAALMKRVKKAKKKTSAPHFVPLARQTVALLREQRAYQATKGIASPFVFSNRNSAAKPMGRDTLNETMRKVGIEKGQQDPHGFRTTFRTLGEERCKIMPMHLERHIAHTKGVGLDQFAGLGVKTDLTSGMGRTYARMTYLDERRIDVQTWADYVDRTVYGTNVVALRPAMPPAPAPMPVAA